MEFVLSFLKCISKVYNSKERDFNETQNTFQAMFLLAIHTFGALKLPLEIKKFLCTAFLRDQKGRNEFQHVHAVGSM